mmetsp:Transcript_14446/g.25444  ORF Transcript_14446/g.25444 Transcript_14446/m.25444 type:complete len:92 (-) Transcript_14446:8-283(-)
MRNLLARGPLHLCEHERTPVNTCSGGALRPVKSKRDGLWNASKTSASASIAVNAPFLPVLPEPDRNQVAECSRGNADGTIAPCDNLLRAGI